MSERVDDELLGPPWEQRQEAAQWDDGLWKELNLSSPMAARHATLTPLRVPESGHVSSPEGVYSMSRTPGAAGVNPFAQESALFDAAQSYVNPFHQAAERLPDANSAVQQGESTRAGRTSSEYDSTNPSPQFGGASSEAAYQAGGRAGGPDTTSLRRTSSGTPNEGSEPESLPKPRPRSQTPKKNGKPPLAFKASPSPSEDDAQAEVAKKVNFDSDQEFNNFIQRMNKSWDTVGEPASFAVNPDMAKLKTKNGKFYSQPLTPQIGRSELMRRAISGFSEPVTPRGRGRGGSHGGAKARANDYKMFRTGSRNVERSQSSSSGKTSRDDSGHPLPCTKEGVVPEPQMVTNVSAGRFFDALQGPEFEVLKDSEDLLLPLDQKWPFLLRFPISTFGISLGLGSQTILWKVAASSPSLAFLHIPKVINLCLWCLALIALFTITCIYVCKLTYYFEAVRREFYHPVRVNFFFAPWIACMFLTIGVPPVIATEIHPAVWCVFMAPIFALELKIYGQWLSGGDRRLSKVANPSTHLSVVGNFVGALLGAEVGWKEVATFFWAVGLAHYLVVFVTLYQRLPTNEALPKELHPVFFLFVAAPSVASVSWMRINGDFDHVSRIVYFIALFLYTSLVVRVNFFRGFRFSVAWWAYTFPMTAASVATIQYSRFVTHPVTQAMAITLTVISSTIVLVLFVSTCFHALVWGTLFPNDMAIAITCKKRKWKKKLKDGESTSTSDHGVENAGESVPCKTTMPINSKTRRESPLGK